MKECELAESAMLDCVPAKKCSDYDQDCRFVKCPALCWAGDENLAPADGYCPLMYSNEGNQEPSS